MADTIEIIQGTATTVEIAGLQGPQGPQGATGATGATGPQGVPGTGIETLTTKGDILYRDTSVAARLPIGSSGQILKVAASGIPEWGAAPASGVTSVNGESGAVSLSAADVGAAATLHAAEHQDGEADQIMASAAIVDTDQLSLNGVYVPDGTTVSGRSVYYRPGTRKNTKLQYNAGTSRWVLIYNLNTVAENDEENTNDPWDSPWMQTLGGPLTIDSITVSQSSLEKLARSTTENVGTAALSDATDFAAASHTHTASAITSGTLLHERGGLEADVSAYNGLLKIASGSTSAVTVTTAGEALLDDADASAQRTTLGAAASGSITTSGLTQATARILGRTSASTGAIEEIQIGSGLSLSAGELSCTVSAGIPATLLDAKGDLIVASAADTAARLPIGATNGHVLTVDSAEATGMKWAAVSGVVSGSVDNAVLRADGVGGSTSQSSAITIDDAVVAFSITGDAGTDIITATGSAFANGQRVRFSSLTGGAGLNTTTNYFVINASGATFQLSTTAGGSASLFTTNITAGTLLTGHALQPLVQLSNAASDTNSALVLCHKGTGPFVVSPAPIDGTTSGGNLRGAEAVCIQTSRSAATQVASGGQSVAIGRRATASADSAIAIGESAIASAIGAVKLGGGGGGGATGIASFCLGWTAAASANRATAIGSESNAAIPAQVAFSGGSNHHQTSLIMWAGTTTNATQTEILCSPMYGNAAAVVPARKCWFGQLYFIAGNSAFTKYFVGTRLVGIYRDNSNNTTLLGSVQTLGTDQTVGAPSWLIDIDANDTNESLRIRVTGEASTTIYWRVIGVFNDSLIGT